jgi:hypothetical protein
MSAQAAWLRMGRRACRASKEQGVAINATAQLSHCFPFGNGLTRAVFAISSEDGSS